MFLQVSKDELSKLCLDLSDYIQLYSNRWSCKQSKKILSKVVFLAETVIKQVDK